jgi:hypothetical protein
MSRSLQVALGLSLLSSLTVGWIAIAAPAVPRVLVDKNKKDKAVKEMMEKVHEGKRSPWKQAQSAAGKSPPDWNGLESQLLKLQQMSGLLKASKVSDISDSSESYADAVTALVAKTKAKDADGARKAIDGLSKSCADCHYKGGIGGELEDD